ncbi:MAG: class I SAM-dependent methyltransferase [Syntrophales bacterium]
MKTKIRSIYHDVLWMFIKKSFLFWQRLGFHITPSHFYEPIPDTRTLKDNLWLKTSDLIGIDFNETKILELLSFFTDKFKAEYDSFPKHKTSTPNEYYVNNGAFESVDGEILYCMIRLFQPRRIFEIGSGNSTYLSAQAIQKNKENSNYECDLIAFDPYPKDVLNPGFPHLTKVVPVKIEDVPLSEFNKLQENDILFIDSSHVLKIGSDVQYEYLEILPRLNKGVLVHVHDIFLPAEYPRDCILKSYMFWTEQYLLQAFLAFNDSFEILWPGSFMHLKHPDELEKAFNSYNRNETWPGSFWIRKIK